ncbi:nucleotidyltransferase family protein [Syntrophomonas wolfei]|jgi:CTP:molybdopterin cytidylyltransferase MocA|uniref:nucleotidyltransferase family protein n=1 Tax=Syntrophomonas wolfei TaxID=863 RepID=UPI000773FA84|nr:nucleotidyltransferase family protein [Syntrophomonas wolfei]
MTDKIKAIVLAAGYSSRMTSMKALLPLGETTVLERVAAAFRQAGITDIRVVTGYRRELFLPLLQKLVLREIYNPFYAEGMFSSVQSGVSSLEPGSEAFFIMPVDIPLLKAATLQTLLEHFDHKQAEVFHPCYQGRRGHPPLLAYSMRQRILQWEGAGGLKGLLRQHEDKSVNIAVPDKAILLDMDTAEQYQHLLTLDITR